ncbi:peptidylprolyl isomerase [Psychrobacter sp. DM4]|uniref:peptidylprolyl isomerase n=1 Tax=Psychrobacter sp. DM4 TaxID=3440637 RepID=UPI003F509EF8
MRFFCLNKISCAVLLSTGMMSLGLSAQAATVTAPVAQATTSTQGSSERLTSTNSTDGIIAIVNDNAILKSDLIDAITQTQARARAAGTPIASSAQLQSEVLNALILRELQLSLVNRVGIKPDNAAINQRLGQIAQAEGVSSIAALQQRLDASQAGSYAALRAQLIEDAAIQSLQQRQVNNRVRISEQDIDAFLSSPEAKRLNQSEYQTVHVRIPYIDDYSRLSQAQRDEALKVAEDLRTRLLQPNTDIDAAIAATQGTYPIPIQGGDMGFHKAASLPTELSSEITKLEVGAVSAPLVTPEGIDIIKLASKKSGDTMMVPQWRTSHILVKVDELQTDALAEQKINDLYAQLQGGADFAALASTYSDDPGSAGRGGDLDWVNEADTVGSFEATMKNTTVGDYSTPFKTQFGWHILKVIDTRNYDASDEYRRTMARQTLYQRLAPQAREDWLQELRAGSYVQVID